MEQGSLWSNGRCTCRMWSKVAVLALGQEACDNKAKEINAKGGQAIGVEANVLDKESLKKKLMK